MAVLIGSTLVSACATLADSRDEQEVLIAVFEAEIQFLLKDASPAMTPVLCLQINPGEAPQNLRKELIARLKHAAPHVVRGGECEVDRAGVADRDTRRRGLLLTAGPVEWLAPDEAEVAMAVARSTAETTHRRYRVVRDGRRWLCLGQVMKMAPA